MATLESAEVAGMLTSKMKAIVRRKHDLYYDIYDNDEEEYSPCPVYEYVNSIAVWRSVDLAGGCHISEPQPHEQDAE